MQLNSKPDDLALLPWIAAAVAKIQRDWTKAERKRRVVQNERPTIRIYREADLPVPPTIENACGGSMKGNKRKKPAGNCELLSGGRE